MIPFYVWATLLAIAGILFLYTVCLQLGKNDWIGQVPPGPLHLPLLGCFLHFLRTRDIFPELSRLFVKHGKVFKYCICRWKIVFVNETKLSENDEGLVEDQTAASFHLFLNSLGLFTQKSEGFLKKLGELSRKVHNYKLETNEFQEIMKNIEDFRANYQTKKLEKLLFYLSNENVKLDGGNKTNLAECAEELKIFRSVIERSPCLLLPNTRCWPHFFLQRKKLRKIVLRIQQKLHQLYITKVKHISANKTELDLFSVLYILAGVSNTTPAFRNRSKQVSNIINNRKTETEGESTSAIHENESGLDILGWRIYRTQEYTKIYKFDVPKGCIVACLELK